MISVWNGPRRTLSHTITSLSMLPSGDPPLAPSTGVSTPSEAGTTAPSRQESSHATLVVDHGMETVYLALSDNIDHSADSAGPYNQRDPPSELGLIGHTRNTTSSSYPVIPHTCTCKMTNPSRLVCFPPNPMRFNR